MGGWGVTDPPSKGRCILRYRTIQYITLWWNRSAQEVLPREQRDKEVFKGERIRGRRVKKKKQKQGSREGCVGLELKLKHKRIRMTDPLRRKNDNHHLLSHLERVPKRSMSPIRQLWRIRRSRELEDQRIKWIVDQSKRIKEQQKSKH